MKKVGLILFSCIFLYACDSAIPFFTVGPASEAIITKTGEIVRGPLKPGLHFYIPYSQKVHIFNVQEVRRFPLNLPMTKKFVAYVYWKVGDSKAFYFASRDKNIQEKIETILAEKFNEAIISFDLKSISLIASKQDKDYKFTNDEYESLLNYLQDAVSEKGVNILNVFFEVNNKQAQQEAEADVK